jgi:glycosyltransferase involved in cell wall biosynthesis
MKQPKIAVVIPCYNEEQTVVEVILAFRKFLPEAEVFVFDNNSSDRTAELARTAGATVCLERRQGKGYVVQAMFREVDADLYVMVDGDTTYPAEVVRSLIEPVARGDADMVIGSRLHEVASSQFPPAQSTWKPSLSLVDQCNLWRAVDGFAFRVSCLQPTSGPGLAACRWRF